MRQMTTSGERKIGHGGDDIRRCDEPGRALEDFRADEIGEAESGGPMTEEDVLRPDHREFITRELALFDELQGVSTFERKVLPEESGNAERDRHSSGRNASRSRHRTFTESALRAHSIGQEGDGACVLITDN